SGTATLSAEMEGKMTDPTLRANVQIADLVFAGFPIGDFSASKTVFKPLYVELTDAHVLKERSRVGLPRGVVRFDDNAAMTADLDVTTEGADVRDLLVMWRFDEDPRWKDLAGQMFTTSRVRYVLGGPRDPCDTGN